MIQTDKFLSTVETMLKDKSIGCHSEQRCTPNPKDLCLNDLCMLFAMIPLQSLLILIPHRGKFASYPLPVLWSILTLIFFVTKCIQKKVVLGEDNTDFVFL